MNYIVLDLEWNQCPGGKNRENKLLPFEIIEIGAVRLNDTLEVIGHFDRRVRPQVYKSLHFRTREVISINMKELLKEACFADVMADFFLWCGDDPVFCTWGPADLTELQRNLTFYQISYPFPFPFLYYDIQKIFSIVYEDRKTRRSLEFAADFLQISKDIPFHTAHNDAFYTAAVMQTLTPSQIADNSSVDYYRTPENRRKEIYLQYNTYLKHISKPFESKSAAMKDRVVTSTYCYLCNRNIPKKIRWFASGSSNYLCLAHCSTHGYFKGKIRLRQNQAGQYYSVKTLKPITEEESYSILEKKEIQRVKRKLHRQYKKNKQ